MSGLCPAGDKRYRRRGQLTDCVDKPCSTYVAVTIRDYTILDLRKECGVDEDIIETVREGKQAEG